MTELDPKEYPKVLIGRLLRENKGQSFSPEEVSERTGVLIEDMQEHVDWLKKSRSLIEENGRYKCGY